MKAETVIEVVNTLIGEVDAVGETNTDEKRFENLKVAEDVCDELIVRIRCASIDKDRVEYSMSKIGNEAFKYLKRLKEWLDEILGEQNDQ